MSVCLCGGWVIPLEFSALEVEERTGALEPELQALESCQDSQLLSLLSSHLDQAHSNDPSLPLPDTGQSQLSPVALSDSELSQPERTEGGGEATVGDHFTFLGEALELEFSSLLEPKGEPNAD